MTRTHRAGGGGRPATAVAIRWHGVPERTEAVDECLRVGEAKSEVRADLGNGREGQDTGLRGDGPVTAVVTVPQFACVWSLALRRFQVMHFPREQDTGPLCPSPAGT